jgi:hypothetical protein
MPNEAKHTPGPFKVFQGTSGTYVESSDGRALARVSGEDAERQPNAKLFAAAPDLLAALRMAYEELCMGGDWEAARRVVDAAIAKAEGR